MGVLAALIIALGFTVLTRRACGVLLRDFDPAARWGMSGLLGLGLLGSLTYLLATLGAIKYVTTVCGVVALGGIVAGKDCFLELKLKKPESLELGLFGLCGISVLLSLIGALSPSTSLDWDSLAYHLAVPKLWIQAGSVYSVPNISHSNFPAAFDSLFLLGLQLGSESAAKIFTVLSFVFGLTAVFGFGRKAFGGASGAFAALVLAGIPMMIWEAGTAYIDVPHGLYGGIALVLAATLAQSEDKIQRAILVALFLSLSAGTKYTGLLVIAVAGLVCLAAAGRGGIKAALVACSLGFALASPWYIRNVVWTGNPVYPFFYGKLGGAHWDARRTVIYSHEQNTFGLGRAPATAESPDFANNPLSVSRLGHSIFGLAYLPGRYVNPGQTAGAGFPFGAVGAALMVCFAAGLAMTRRKTVEGNVVLGCLIMTVAWFAVSQQSRYILTLAVPLSFVGAWLASQPKWGRGFGIVFGLQAVFSLYLVHSMITADQLPVVLGKEDPAAYRAKRVGFTKGAAAISEAKAGKVALYDEVFGYLLDVPYMWANPGHGDYIPYDSLNDGVAYAAKMKELGFTHIYVNIFPVGSPKEPGQRWIQAASGTPYSAEERKNLMDSFELRYKVLIAEAASGGKLVPVSSGNSWVLYAIAD